MLDRSVLFLMRNNEVLGPKYAIGRLAITTEQFQISGLVVFPQISDDLHHHFAIDFVVTLDLPHHLNITE